MLTARELVRETVLGYLFWTLFQALAPMIWFYPLNELEITGYEGFAAVLFSPILLAVPGLQSLLRSSIGTALLRLISVGCLASFQAPTTLLRLVILSVGCSTIMLVLTTSLTHRSTCIRSQTIAGLVLGLIAFVSSRVWYTTFVPAWWDPKSNNIVIALTAIASFDKILNGSASSIVSPFTPTTSSQSHPLTQSSIGKKNLDPQSPPPTPTLPHPPSTRGSCIVTGLGFGSLIYVIQAVFGEVSVVSRWTVSGRPDHGPEPYPWGAAVLVALWLGSLLAPHVRVTSSILWWVVGFAAHLALYLLPTWQGFVGGLVLAVYVTSVLPLLADQVSMSSPVRTLLVAALAWLVQLLFSVWTVAYNFVPGGVYTRERTLWLIITSMSCIGLAMLTGKRLVSPFHGPGSFSAFPLARYQLKSRSSFSKSRGSASSSGKTSLSALAGEKSLSSSSGIKVSYMLTLLMLFGLGGFLYREPRQHFPHPAKNNFTAAIWTYHFGYDNKGWPSLEQGAVLLEDTGADFITLLESDASKPFLGNNDLGMWLGERLGMYVDFGPSTRDHTWGNLFLSRYPIIKSKHHLLPSPEGELAPAVTATIDFSPGSTGGHVDFVVTHMGNDRDYLDRKLQAEFLSDELSKAENPVVFLGYVTSKPGSRDYVTLTKRGNVKDIDPTDGDRWCEYIMYRGLTRLAYARISHGGLSDTEVQCAKFRIPSHHRVSEDGKALTDEDNKRTVTDPSLVEENVRFNPRFGKYSDGHNWANAEQHRFHMSTPKYFVPAK